MSIAVVSFARWHPAGTPWLSATCWWLRLAYGSTCDPGALLAFSRRDHRAIPGRAPGRVHARCLGWRCPRVLPLCGTAPRGVSRLTKAAAGAALVGIAVFLSPLGERIIRVIPALGGNVDTYNIIYRHRLFERAWGIIQQTPMLGDPGALLKMQGLRQGQGIIDLVNTYLDILLSNGFVGLTLFLLFVLIPMLRSWSLSRKFRATNPDLGMLGASLVASILAMLVMLENRESPRRAAKDLYALVAFSAAFAFFGRSQSAVAGARRR